MWEKGNNTLAQKEDTSELLYSRVSPNSSSVVAGATTALLQQQKLLEALQQLNATHDIYVMCPVQSCRQNGAGGAHNVDLDQHQLQKSGVSSEYFYYKQSHLKPAIVICYWQSSLWIVIQELTTERYWRSSHNYKNEQTFWGLNGFVLDDTPVRRGSCCAFCRQNCFKSAAAWET